MICAVLSVVCVAASVFKPSLSPYLYSSSIAPLPMLMKLLTYGVYMTTVLPSGGKNCPLVAASLPYLFSWTTTDEKGAVATLRFLSI